MKDGVNIKEEVYSFKDKAFAKSNSKEFIKV